MRRHKRRVWSPWAGLFLLVWAVGGGAAPAQANTVILVTTPVDQISPTDGQCSLREAIRSANLDGPSGAVGGECAGGAGVDTVLVPPGVYALSLAGGHEDAALSGDLDIAGPLSVIGYLGAGQTVIDGGGLDRVLDILPGASAVSLSGLTLQGGVVITDSGGGIRLGAGASLTLTNSALISNTAAVQGGAVYNAAGRMVLSSVVISGNVAGQGAGLANAGLAWLEHSQLVGNDASTQGQGGALFNSGALSLTEVEVAGNYAGQGGGVYMAGGTLRGLDSVFQRNWALLGSGGGLEIAAGDVQLQGGAIADNSVLNLLITGTVTGGGLSNRAGRVSLDQTSIVNNRAQAGGFRTEANGLGGGLYNAGALTVTESLIANNTAAGADAGMHPSQDGLGGGIYNSGGLLVLTSTLAANSAQGAPGGCCHPSGNGWGGGLYNSGTASLGFSSLISNTAAGGLLGSGGGLFNAAWITITNSTLSGNQALTEGGALVSQVDSTPTVGAELLHVTIANNWAAEAGGVRAVGAFTLAHSLLAENSTSAAGAHPDCLGTLTLIGENFIQNPAGCAVLGQVEELISSRWAGLGGLQANGGATLTQALWPSSPALEAAGVDALCPAVDQRGVPRPQGQRCDLGAYEAVLFHLYLPMVQAP